MLKSFHLVLCLMFLLSANLGKVRKKFDLPWDKLGRAGYELWSQVGMKWIQNQSNILVSEIHCHIKSSNVPPPQTTVNCGLKCTTVPVSYIYVKLTARYQIWLAEHWPDNLSKTPEHILDAYMQKQGWEKTSLDCSLQWSARTQFMFKAGQKFMFQTVEKFTWVDSRSMQ